MYVMLSPTNVTKEAIHSGQFMVSSFEAEAQDDEFQVAVPISEEILTQADINNSKTSLNNLLQCMSFAYRHKLTSPKWNRFKGVRLRWKDKIRLNNLIWRCWHMQFIKKSNYMICQFASPVEIVDIHKQPEAVVLEGKYWKRKFNAVTAEYKKWRLFYRSLLQNGFKERQKLLNEFIEWQQKNNSDVRIDDDYVNFISDTLFSTVTSNHRIFEFPNARDDKSTNIADLIQPSLGQLQPNLDEFMDTIEPLQDLFSPPKLPPVLEECQMPSDSSNNVYNNQSYGNVNACYQTNQHPMSLHSELNHLKMTNMRQETVVDPACPLHTGNYSTEENYQSNFPSMFHQHSNGDYQSNSNSFNSIPPEAAVQTHQNEIQLPAAPPPPPAYPFEFNTSNMGHESVISSNSYNQHQNMTDNSVMTYGNGSSSSSSSNDFKNRTQQIQTYSKFPPTIRQTQRSRSRQTQPKQKIMPSSMSSSNDNNQSVLLAQLLSSNNMFSTPSASGVSHNMTKFRSTNGSYQSYQQVPQVPQIPQIPYQLIERRARTPDHVLTSYTDHLVYRKPSPVFMNQSSECNVYNLLTPNTRGLIDAVGTPGGIHQIPQIQPRFNIPHSNSQGYSAYRPPPSQEYVCHPALDNPSPPSNQPSPTHNYSQPLITPIPQSLNISTSSMACNTELCQKTISPNLTNESVNLSQRNGGSMLMPTHGMLPGSSRTPYKEHRRVCHINAEQKRRCNIKNGFDTLNMLIPQINQNPNAKMSKAAMLQKGADYIIQLRSERARLYDERQNLQQQVEALNLSISNCQAMLPATGAPFSRQRTTKMKEMYDEYVKKKTLENWKFYILGLIAEPLLHSFSSSVSNSSYDEMNRTTQQWVEQHCTLGDLRPIALNALRNLCTSTEILTDPNNLPEEIKNIIQRNQSNNQPSGNRN